MQKDVVHHFQKNGTSFCFFFCLNFFYFICRPSFHVINFFICSYSATLKNEGKSYLIPSHGQKFFLTFQMLLGWPSPSHPTYEKCLSTHLCRTGLSFCFFHLRLKKRGRSYCCVSGTMYFVWTFRPNHIQLDILHSFVLPSHIQHLTFPQEAIINTHIQLFFSRFWWAIRNRQARRIFKWII